MRRADAESDLLRCTDMTHTQIAAFADVYHFSRRFKQLRDEPPAHFRRRYRL